MNKVIESMVVWGFGKGIYKSMGREKLGSLTGVKSNSTPTGVGEMGTRWSFSLDCHPG
jgi:hypothetical protein